MFSDRIGIYSRRIADLYAVTRGDDVERPYAARTSRLYDRQLRCKAKSPLP